MVIQKHKTKIIETIGPASSSPEMLERLIHAGMNIARLNFSHVNFEGHAELIKGIRAAEKATKKRGSERCNKIKFLFLIKTKT